jgi:hypothetical protein
MNQKYKFSIYKVTSQVVLSGTLLIGAIPSVQAADFNCTWQGGAGNWSELNWNSGCSGVFPNNGGSTYDANLSTGNITLDQNIIIQAFNFGGGTLGGNNNLITNDLFSWTGGVMAGTGTTRAEGGLDLSGGFKDIQNGRTLVNASGQTANWTEGDMRLLGGNARLVNEAGATFNIQADGARLLSSGLFDNAGDLFVNLNDSTQSIRILTRLNNSGTVNVQSGELRLGNAGTSSGSFVGGSNGQLNFSGSGVRTLEAASSITATNVKFSNVDGGGGTTNINGAYDVDNTEVIGNTANFNADSQTGTLTQSGGNLSGNATLTVTGQTSWTGGVMSGTGTTRAEGGLDLSGGFKDIQNGRTLVNASGQTANWTEGDMRLLGGNARLVNEAGATFNIQADGARLLSSGLFDNAGTLVVALSEGAEQVTIQPNVVNSGAIDLQQDNLVLGGNYTQTSTGSLLIDIGGLISGDEFDVLNISGNAILDGFFEITLVDLIDPDNNSNPFAPTIGDTFDVLISSNITNNGLSLSGPNGGQFEYSIVDLVNGNQALRLGSVIPLPASVWLFISAIIGFAGIGNRRK